MARIENRPKVILTKEEIDTLTKARNIINTIADEDTNAVIFNHCDNYESEWCWVDTFIGTLVYISEVE